MGWSFKPLPGFGLDAIETLVLLIIRDMLDVRAIKIGGFGVNHCSIPF